MNGSYFTNVVTGDEACYRTIQNDVKKRDSTVGDGVDESTEYLYCTVIFFGACSGVVRG